MGAMTVGHLLTLIGAGLIISGIGYWTSVIVKAHCKRREQNEANGRPSSPSIFDYLYCFACILSGAGFLVAALFS